MNTFIVYTYNSWSCPKIQTKEIQGSDILSALQSSGLNYSEILAVKLKGVEQAVVGV